MILSQPQRSRNQVWKRELGFVRTNLTVVSSTAVTEAIPSTNLEFELKPVFFITVSVVKTTSAAVKGSPSFQVTPLRRGIVHSVKSALYFASPSAKPLMILPVAKSTDQSGSSARFCRPRSCHFQPTHRFILSGVPTRPVSCLTSTVSRRGKVPSTSATASGVLVGLGVAVTTTGYPLQYG